MKIVPGAKFQFGNRSYTVQSVDNGVVEYTLEGPIGKPVTLQRSLAEFQQSVASAAQAGHPATYSKGQVIQTDDGTYTVRSISKGKINFDAECPAGEYRASLPVDTFHALIQAKTTALPTPTAEQPTPRSTVMLKEFHARTDFPAAPTEVIEKPSDAAVSPATLPPGLGQHVAVAPIRGTAQEFSAEEIAECERLDRLYGELSERDRLFIVSRYDDEQGLEPTYKRKNFRDEAPLRARRRRFWMIVGLIPGISLLLWIGKLIRADSQHREDSFVLKELRERSNRDPGLKSVIDEADQEWIESERPDPEDE